MSALRYKNGVSAKTCQQNFVQILDVEGMPKVKKNGDTKKKDPDIEVISRLRH